MNLHTSDLAGLTAGRWFQRLPADFAQALLEMGHLRHLQTGEVLFLRDGAPCGLYGLVSGSVRFSGHGHHADSAREAVLVVLSPPEWFGEIALFDDAPRTHDAHAAEASTLLHVPHGALLGWLQKHPAHWRELGLLMADKLRLAFVSMEAQMLLPASQRLAQRLVLMAQGHGLAATPGGHRSSIAVTQEELALMLGISRQTTNQILQSFKDQGLIAVHRGELELLDFGALRAFAP
jgi:CRP/FNR family transcriptional regulator, cyclic AMP receptor protein